MGNMLHSPAGIFVDENFDLYVADCSNNRIQLFRSGQLNAVTVAGSGSLTPTITLSVPLDVILDAEKYLYISDQGRNRIVASGLSGFRCLVGCSGGFGSASNQLHYPSSLRFDSYGNIFVIDAFNQRIQKFLLTTSLCGGKIRTRAIGNLKNAVTKVPLKPMLVSYNRPKFSPCATWNSRGISFANISTIGSQPYGIFINRNNTVYVVDQQNGRIQIWFNKNFNSPQTISDNLFMSYAIFVTFDGDIYVNSGNSSGRIHKWSWKSNTTVFVMDFGQKCYGIFIDIDNNLYCSMRDYHQVVRKALDGRSNELKIVAGMGCSGSDSSRLNSPYGIFVTIDMNLYVADCQNNRIQLFEPNQLDAVTVAGSGQSQSFLLNCPTGIVLDADGYLFIVDRNHHRIIRSGPNNFSCIIGCSPSELSYPQTMAFDTYGNIYITDRDNHRIQMFLLQTNSCVTTTTTTPFFISSSSETCSEPIIELIPSGISLSKRLKFQSRQNIDISSNIKLNCNQSLLIRTNWTIFKCLLNCSNEIQLNQPMDTHLFIPARTLSNGIYQFKLTATLNSASVSSSVYIEIIRSTIITNLIPFDTLIWTHNYEKDLILNPGEYSFDHNRILFKKDDWIYLYYCRMDSNNFQLIDNESSWKSNNMINSSITIFKSALQLNFTYQFMVQMIDRHNSSIQSIGYLTVDIKHLHSPVLLISCVISTMCLLNRAYHYINPTTQLALSSFCFGNCSSLKNIQWNISPGSINSSWIYGSNSANLTILKDFFTENRNITYWHLEVIYSFESMMSKAKFHMEINESPKNGHCSIDPLNGTILTLFTINCSNWFDQDEIKDYTFYLNHQMMLVQSTESIVQVRLPAGINQLLIVHIRDTFYSITEFHFPAISIIADLNLIDHLSYDADQTILGQTITSISHLFNEINNEMIENFAQNGIPSTSISVTSLDNEIFPMRNSSNNSLVMKLNEQLNQHAQRREYLMMLMNKFSTITPDDVKFQSSILAILTQSTNQLTRQTSSMASRKCHQLADSLKFIATKQSYENIQFITAHLAECTTNAFTSVNGVLSGRINELQLDLIRTNQGNNPKQILNKIAKEMNETISMLTSALNIHLNLNQYIQINTSSIYLLLNKTLLPNINETILVRRIIQPVALNDDTLSYTNLSRSLSFSILDKNVNEIETNPMEFFVHRDPNIIIPEMFLQNVTFNTDKNSLFHYHRVNLTQNINSNLTFSIHFEMHPLNRNLSYLFIYKFDDQPQLNSMDNWTLFCPKDLNDEEIYIYFLDNHQTLNHHSIVYGIREVNERFCLNKTYHIDVFTINKPFHFTSNYQIRIYQSACLYLNSNNQWQSDGLLVGPLTNHQQTQCFSTHLTTFIT